MPIFIGDKLVSGGNENSLPLTGGTLSGGVSFKDGENIVGHINANSYDASLTATTDGTFDRYRRLYISNPNNPIVDASSVIGFQDYDANGEDKYYKLFGEHNFVIDATSSTDDMDVYFMQGTHCKMYKTNGNTLNTPYKKGKTEGRDALIISYASSDTYGQQIAYISGGGVFTRNLGNGNISDWYVNYSAIHSQADLVAGQSGLTNGLCYLVYE